MAQSIDPNAFTAPFQVTRSMHRDIYEAVDPQKLSYLASRKVFLIARAAGGLGSNIARTWSEAGAKGVVLFGRDQKKLEVVAAGSERVLMITGDVIREEDVGVERAVVKFGALDVVINAAGTMKVDASIDSTAPSRWWLDHEFNVKATYNLVHCFISITGGKGTFINIMSLGATFLVPGISSYSTAKLSAIKLAEHLDLEQSHLRVFSIYPGIVEASDGSGMVVKHFTLFAKDKQRLTAAMTMYLVKRGADSLRSGFVSVSWNIGEIEAHEDEITRRKLLITILEKNTPPC